MNLSRSNLRRLLMRLRAEADNTVLASDRRALGGIADLLEAEAITPAQANALAAGIREGDTARELALWLLELIG